MLPLVGLVRSSKPLKMQSPPRENGITEVIHNFFVELFHGAITVPEQFATIMVVRNTVVNSNDSLIVLMDILVEGMVGAEIALHIGDEPVM